MDDSVPFVSSLSKDPTKYIHDAQHRWLSILVKAQTPVTVEQLKTAGIHACFAIVDKENDLSLGQHHSQENLQYYVGSIG